MTAKEFVRLRTTKALGALVLVLGALLTASWALLPSVSWDGAVFFRLHVTVTDAQTGRPVGNALLCLVEMQPASQSSSDTVERDAPPPLARATTDGAGRATLSAFFDAGGSYSLFWRTGRAVGFERRWIEASAVGYEPARIKLSQFTGRARSIRASHDLLVAVQLRRHQP